MVRDTPSGGIVAYPIKNDRDILSAAGRAEAIQLMDRKCGRRYVIEREGEVPRVRADIDRKWQGQLTGDRQWGIQFSCKE